MELWRAVLKWRKRAAMRKADSAEIAIVMTDTTAKRTFLLECSWREMETEAQDAMNKRMNAIRMKGAAENISNPKLQHRPGDWERYRA